MVSADVSGTSECSTQKLGGGETPRTFVTSLHVRTVRNRSHHFIGFPNLTFSVDSFAPEVTADNAKNVVRDPAASFVRFLPRIFCSGRASRRYKAHWLG
jgi:hypothetical protein